MNDMQLLAFVRACFLEVLHAPEDFYTGVKTAKTLREMKTLVLDYPASLTPADGTDGYTLWCAKFDAKHLPAKWSNLIIYPCAQHAERFLECVRGGCERPPLNEELSYLAISAPRLTLATRCEELGLPAPIVSHLREPFHTELCWAREALK